MRVRPDAIARVFERALAALNPLRDKRAAAALGSARTGGSALIMLSVAIVTALVAGVVITPGGDQVFARDGYSGRDIYASALGDEGGSMRAERRSSAWIARAPHVWQEVAERVSRWTGHRRAGPMPADARIVEASAGPSRATPPAPFTHTVCVRLCDGYHFPVGDVHREGDLDTQAAVCSSACPGAPTRLFTEPSASSDISEALAVSNGEPYDALPVAYAHTSEVGPTCTCHREGESQAALLSPLNDVTLRRGDSIMTPVGWRVFLGTRHWPYRRDDFSSLRASNLPAKTRSTLTALEDATLHRSSTTRLGDADLHIRLRSRLSGEKLVRLLGPSTVYQR